MLQSTLVTTDISTEPVYAKDLKVGELGKCTDTYKGEFLLRTFDGVVSLNNPEHTWENNATVRVIRIPNATVTLTFGSGS